MKKFLLIIGLFITTLAGSLSLFSGTQFEAFAGNDNNKAQVPNPGNGSDNTCEGIELDEWDGTSTGWVKLEVPEDGTTNLVTHDFGSNFTVAKICIKGGNSQRPNGYRETFESDGWLQKNDLNCVGAEGIGTSVGTAKRNDELSNDSGCADISHASFKLVENKEEELDKISPILECVEHNGENSYTARFGYETHNDETVVIPIGDNNKITGGGLSGIDQGQITEFVYPAVNHPAGREGRSPFDVGVFSVDFDGSNLVWTLVSDSARTATASKDSKICPEPTPTIRWCVPTENGFEAQAIPDTGELPETGKPWETGMDKWCEFEKPEPTPTPEPDDPRYSHLRHDVSCEWDYVQLTYNITDDGKPVKDSEVTFTYAGHKRTVKTNQDGRARVRINLGDDREVAKASAKDFPSRETTVVNPTDCPAVGGQVLGTSTDSEGGVLGISTFADTGSTNQTGILASLLTMMVGGMMAIRNAYRETV